LTVSLVDCAKRRVGMRPIVGNDGDADLAKGGRRDCEKEAGGNDDQ
jgi:hypothetical protein